MLISGQWADAALIKQFINFKPHAPPLPLSLFPSPDALTFDELGSILSSQTNDPIPLTAIPPPIQQNANQNPDQTAHASADSPHPGHSDAATQHITSAADYGMITCISVGSSQGSALSSLSTFLLGSGGDDPTARVLIFLLPDNPSPPPALAQAAWMMRGVVRACCSRPCSV